MIATMSKYVNICIIEGEKGSILAKEVLKYAF